MATYYWVGGSGTWDASTTTHWALNSGGAGGAGVPTSADNVIADSLSGTGTVTFAVSGAVCNDISWSNSNLRLGASVPSPTQALTVYGSMFLASGTITSGFSTCVITFAATTTGKTINTNYTIGSIFSNIQPIFDGVGGGWTLSSGFGGGSGDIVLRNGSLNTNGYPLEFGNYTYSATGTFNLTLGTSICRFNYTWGFGTTTGLTFSGASSTIVSVGPSFANFNGGGFTYGSLQLIWPTVYNGRVTFTGANTFSSISGTPTATSFTQTLTFPASTTTTVGSFTASGVSGGLLTVHSSISGTRATLAKSGGGIVNGINYLSVKDINGTPANTWFVGSNSTNVSNNTGIIFANGFAGSVTESTTLSDSTITLASFVSSITEAILSETDVESLIATFSAAITEAILAETDIESLIATFSTVISEALNVVDLKNVTANFSPSISEPATLSEYLTVAANLIVQNIEHVNLADLSQSAAAFRLSTTENINLLDAPIGFAWFKINNTEGTQWVLIDNRQ